MRFLVLSIATLVLACGYSASKADAEPLVTISCEKPNGISIKYGTSLLEHLEDSKNNQPEPPPSLKEPTKDGYLATPTFVIDSNRKEMIVIWAELPEDAVLRKKSKELNLLTIPPPPATDATVVLFTDDQISAIEVDPWSIMTYSFFPMLGTAFIGQQAAELGTKNTAELATFAHCQFSWANPKDDPAKKRK